MNMIGLPLDLKVKILKKILTTSEKEVTSFVKNKKYSAIVEVLNKQ